MANAVIVNKTLRIGVAESLYAAAGGAFNTTGTCGTAPNGTFQLPPQSSNYRGALSLFIVPVGGTVTAATFQLEVSANPQGSTNGASTFGIVNRLANYAAATAALSAYSGISLLNPVSLDISALASAADLRLNFTTVTLGTGTGFDVYALIT